MEEDGQGGEEREPSRPTVTRATTDPCMRRNPSRPHIRAAVVTWTSASTTAAVANHAFAAIVDENTEVTMSV